MGKHGDDGQPTQTLGHDVLELHLAVPQVQLNLWHLKHKIGNIFNTNTVMMLSSPHHKRIKGRKGKLRNASLVFASHVHHNP